MAERIALDSGAIIKLAAGDPLTRAVLRTWTENGWESIVSAPVLAETLRGRSADAGVHRILKSRPNAITIVSLSEAAGRDAGRRLGTTGMDARHTVDALIVANAVAEHAEHIVTGDRNDIARLADSDLRVIAI